MTLFKTLRNMAAAGIAATLIGCVNSPTGVEQLTKEKGEESVIQISIGTPIIYCIQSTDSARILTNEFYFTEKDPAIKFYIKTDYGDGTTKIDSAMNTFEQAESTSIGRMLKKTEYEYNNPGEFKINVIVDRDKDFINGTKYELDREIK